MNIIVKSSFCVVVLIGTGSVSRLAYDTTIVLIVAGLVVSYSILQSDVG